MINAHIIVIIRDLNKNSLGDRTYWGAKDMKLQCWIIVINMLP